MRVIKKLSPIFLLLLLSVWAPKQCLAEVGWYIPKPNIEVGDKIVYRPNTDNIKWVEKWGYLVKKLDGTKIISLSSMKVKHSKGEFAPEPFKCETHYKVEPKQPIEIYTYWRNGKLYSLVFVNGVLKHYHVYD